VFVQFDAGFMAGLEKGKSRLRANYLCRAQNLFNMAHAVYPALIAESWRLVTRRRQHSSLLVKFIGSNEGAMSALGH
jgi:hypothetical protein